MIVKPFRGKTHIHLFYWPINKLNTFSITSCPIHSIQPLSPITYPTIDLSSAQLEQVSKLITPPSSKKDQTRSFLLLIILESDSLSVVPVSKTIELLPDPGEFEDNTLGQLGIFATGGEVDVNFVINNGLKITDQNNCNGQEVVQEFKPNQLPI